MNNTCAELAQLMESMAGLQCLVLIFVLLFMYARRSIWTESKMKFIGQLALLLLVSGAALSLLEYLSTMCG